eukprot:TRINITY_DN11750_c0_g1_i1.p1 TRINITY_DN11750_c0_g1~~TRINITY_DN11750_c0_g1_i1.p1  ORF type:complete len:399 (+),score=62.04 TRINITY_DN11750_c0_g1_i1:77-1273(+)
MLHQRLCEYVVARCGGQWSAATQRNVERALAGLNQHAAAADPKACADVAAACAARRVTVPDDLRRRAALHTPPAKSPQHTELLRRAVAAARGGKLKEDRLLGILADLQRTQAPPEAVMKLARGYADGGEWTGWSPAELAALTRCLQAAKAHAFPWTGCVRDGGLHPAVTPGLLAAFHKPAADPAPVVRVDTLLRLGRLGSRDVKGVKPLGLPPDALRAVKESLRRNAKCVQSGYSQQAAVLFRMAVRYEVPEVARHLVGLLDTACVGDIPAEAACEYVLSLHEGKSACALALPQVARCISDDAPFDRAFSNSELAEMAECFARASEATRGLFESIERRVVWSDTAWAGRRHAHDVVRLIRAFVTAMVVPPDIVQARAEPFLQRANARRDARKATLDVV